MKASQLFSLPETLPFAQFFKPDDYPWEWVPKIKEALESFNFVAADKREDIPRGVVILGDVFIHPSVILPSHAHIQGPAYIGAHTEIRAGVLIRGNVIVGARCVLGNACEYKNSLLMDDVQTPHFNYIGDSILGTGSHIAAGGVLANLRFDKKNITIRTEREKIPTNLKKLGALLGELAEVGCNAVLQPGTILSKKAIVGPTCAFGGFLGEGQVVMSPRPLLQP